ncbi:4-(cytidine 5'-diphospho)-2-C-methyl-D-erythritol kinase [Erysipelothrix rhusiopathiae]|uniref:4-(cytidine 5'-diphospho)-2-C-methyl-D-erythritol kinase n=1 Tax=Erysipelothrix rhusiopathiae TaxID=1648 RepID=UPI000F436345|nr:4-(cytidine 5'-diphospho)-2-C-methyl-D-erythritol kinase [Erysipelothrix rhusiopathiae]AYV33866.1 4-(cytidine 5'-diphospho)-2-C-methyl-D-erythritol kinase [Erysipelothrix rhusiopathiae]MDE8081464.1 4-(cytidine 5'-diphospho)-2-C-methyl-D-erythritol kinase [Erysipelothrix rhusiopathiae]MDE8267891.1 4-(cytidine 5'-diphospho)-2-C-methyl-D-erythritol kinase [Erysipelothrix rhusiopathiae]MDE8281208.1 4-(cytidine 5'-diphospho)-2-C-methyl-D-erythritol kinase [Erysipelothrix rhusiopathiae]MDE8314029
MRKKAYAKITLYLHAEKRVDNMLHFKNIIVPIDLFDMVYLEKHDTMHIETDKTYLPNDKRNTVFKALMIMKRQFNLEDNFKVRIVKNIPAQAGLGGGSADAACVIRMIDEMYQLNLTDEALIQIARQIDEDTPYCLFNQPMVVEGIGDVLTPLDLDMDLYYLIIKPSFGVSTKSFLKRFKDFTDLKMFNRCLEAIHNNDYKALVENTHNDFQQPVIKRNTRLKKVVRILEKQGLEGVCMSGSGTSIYGLSDQKEKVMEAYETLVLDYPFIKYGKILKSND